MFVHKPPRGDKTWQLMKVFFKDEESLCSVCVPNQPLQHLHVKEEYSMQSHDVYDLYVSRLNSIMLRRSTEGLFF